MKWTPSMVATLKLMAAEGRSPGEIALVLAVVSRRAVIAKAERLGLDTGWAK